MSGTVPHGKFYWNELMTDDVEKAKAFYAQLLGWSFTGMPIEGHQDATYTIALKGEEPVAGLVDKTLFVPAAVPSHWFSYIAVDDVDVAVQVVEGNGGQVVRPPFDVPDVGRIAIIMDATGAPLGLMTPANP